MYVHVLHVCVCAHECVCDSVFVYVCMCYVYVCMCVHSLAGQTASFGSLYSGAPLKRTPLGP